MDGELYQVAFQVEGFPKGCIQLCNESIERRLLAAATTLNGHVQSRIANAAVTLKPASPQTPQCSASKRLGLSANDSVYLNQSRPWSAPRFLTPTLDMLLPLFISCLLLLRASLAFKITGATGGHNLTTGARPCRLDINDFAQSGPPFDLYIQALNQLQKTDQADPLSYFQIAGE